jgi:3-hydroxyisobutyrate dehydrogenase
MAQNTQRIGWIGMGRMGYPMAERLLKAGYDVSIWNRTRAKAEPLAKSGRQDRRQAVRPRRRRRRLLHRRRGQGRRGAVYFGKDGVLSAGNGKVPPVFVDCSTIAVDESATSARAEGARRRLHLRAGERQRQGHQGRQAVVGLLRPGGRLPQDGSMMKVVAPKGVSYVGDGELARVCKIAHNVMLGVVIQNLIEITLLVNKMGVPRHAFLAFLNNGVMGSMFTAYKSPALVNLDWTTTFTPELLRKDLDLGSNSPRDGRADAGDGGDARDPADAHRRGDAAEESRGVSGRRISRR